MILHQHQSRNRERQQPPTAPNMRNRIERLQAKIIKAGCRLLKRANLHKCLYPVNVPVDMKTDGQITAVINCPYVKCRKAKISTEIAVEIAENPKRDFIPNMRAFQDHIDTHFV